jgi:hypothetical protein
VADQATQFFKDRTIDLGSIAAGVTGPLDLEFKFDLVSSIPDEGFGAQLLVSNASIGAGGLPADANHDGKVDFIDFQRLEISFGGPGDFAHGDFDGNGAVDRDDFSVLYNYYGQTASASAADLEKINAFAASEGIDLPEPGIVSLLGIGAFGVLLRRRRGRKTLRKQAPFQSS